MALLCLDPLIKRLAQALSGIGAIGLASEIIINALPQAYPKIPHQIYVLIFWSGAILFLFYPLQLLIRKVPRFLSDWKLQCPITRRINPIPLNMALYVGRFWADLKKLETEDSISLMITLFNQTDSNIIIEGVRGKLKLEIYNLTESTTAVIKEDLPLIVVAHSHNGCIITLQQRIPKEKTTKIFELLESEKSISFDFRQLNFLVHQEGRGGEPITLYNFHGISCFRPKPNDVMVSGVVFLGSASGTV